MVQWFKEIWHTETMATKGTGHTLNGISIIDRGLKERKALVEGALIQNCKQFLSFTIK